MGALGGPFGEYEPMHLGEGIRVDNFCRPDGDGEVALTFETDTRGCFTIALMGDSLPNHGPELEHLPDCDENTPILVQEAFEGGWVIFLPRYTGCFFNAPLP